MNLKEMALTSELIFKIIEREIKAMYENEKEHGLSKQDADKVKIYSDILDKTRNRRELGNSNNPAADMETEDLVKDFYDEPEET